MPADGGPPEADIGLIKVTAAPNRYVRYLYPVAVEL